MVFVLILLLIIIFVASLIFISPYLLYVGSYEGGFDKKSFRLVDPAENILYFLQPDMREAIRTIIQKPVPTITTLEEVPECIKYRNSTPFISRAVHIGQLKLFLTEMQFLVESLNSYEESVYVVYAGSAPGNKLGILHEMFPNVKFILVDPHDHLIMYGEKNHFDMPYRNEVVYLRTSTTNMWNVYNEQIINMWEDNTKVQTYNKHSNNAKNTTFSFDKKVKKHDSNIAEFIQNSQYVYYIIEGFYTTDLSNCLVSLKKHKPLYFISDIRSRRDEHSFPEDMDIVWNSSMQMEWLDILKPLKAMLKFRPSYFEEKDISSFKKLMNKSPYVNSFKATKKKIDFVEDYLAGTFKYYEAEKINLQAFAGVSSSEGRLIISNFDKIVEYNVKEYEEKFSYYNRAMRDIGFHDDNSDMWNKDIGIDACGDCSLMCRLFRLYYTKFHKLPHNDAGVEGSKAIKKLMNDIKRTFFVKGSAHGYFYKQYNSLDDVLRGQAENMLIQYVGDNYIDLLKVSQPSVTLELALQRAHTYILLKEKILQLENKSKARKLFKIAFKSFVLRDYYTKMQHHLNVLEKIQYIIKQMYFDIKEIDEIILMINNIKPSFQKAKIVKTKNGFKINDIDLHVNDTRYELLKQHVSDEEIVKQLLWFYYMYDTEFINMKHLAEQIIEKYKIKDVYEYCDSEIYSFFLKTDLKASVHMKTLYTKANSIFDKDILPNSLIFVHIYSMNDVLQTILCKHLQEMYYEKNIKVVIISYNTGLIFNGFDFKKFPIQITQNNCAKQGSVILSLGIEDVFDNL